MRTRGASTNAAAHADYLGGDPVEGRSIAGGRLNVDPSGLRFSGPGGVELRLPLDSLLGISISGRAAEHSRRALHGTMRVAGMRGEEPAEWTFAIDRSAATALRGRVDRELASRGQAPLPFVEELDGFPLRRPPAHPLHLPGRSLNLQLAELGHRLNSLDARRSARGRRRYLPWILLGAALIAAEVIVPLILIRAG